MPCDHFDRDEKGQSKQRLECLQGGSASLVLKIVSSWFPSVLVSVYVLDVGIEGESVA